MLNQELNNEVVTFVSAPTPNNMQQYGVQPPCSMQYFTPPPSAYVYSDGTPVIPTDSSPKPFPLPGPQWQEPGFVGGPGNFMPQQAAGPTGGGGQQMRLGIQPGGPPPQQGPPQSQPTPTSTPPGAPVDMKPNSHIPGQTLQQGNIDIAGMYVQNQPPRAPSGNQNFHNSYPTARLPTPRMARNPQVATMSSNNVQGIYPNPGMMAYGMMQPIPQTTIMMNVPHVSYQQATYPNQRHQGQNSNHNFYNPAPIIVGPTTQPFYPGQNYYSQLIQRPYIPPNPGTGPATQPGAPGPGPIPTLSNAPTGMVQNQQQQNLSQESKRRKHAIPIINPVTGADIFNDQPTSGNNNNVTPPGSNDSSARETPQPVSLPQSPFVPLHNPDIQDSEVQRSVSVPSYPPNPFFNRNPNLFNFPPPNLARCSQNSIANNVQHTGSNVYIANLYLGNSNEAIQQNGPVNTPLEPFNGNTPSPSLTPSPSSVHFPSQFPPEFIQSPPPEFMSQASAFILTPPPEIIESPPHLNTVANPNIGGPYSPILTMMNNSIQFPILPPQPPVPFLNGVRPQQLPVPFPNGVQPQQTPVPFMNGVYQKIFYPHGNVCGTSPQKNEDNWRRERYASESSNQSKRPQQNVRNDRRTNKGPRCRKNIQRFNQTSVENTQIVPT